MTPSALVAELQARGVILCPDGERLTVQPASRVTPAEFEALRQCKAEVIRLLAGPAAALLPMALDEFGRSGSPLEVRVPWFPTTLWFVPDARHLDALAREGVDRGRIWTALELLDLMAGGKLLPEAVRTVARVKAAFGAEVVEVRVHRPEGA